MADWKQQLETWLKEQWATPKGMVVALLAAAILVLIFLSRFDIGQISRAEWIMVLLIFIAGPIIWWFTCLPRAPKEHIGFGVAIPERLPANRKKDPGYAGI